MDNSTSPIGGLSRSRTASDANLTFPATMTATPPNIDSSLSPATPDARTHPHRLLTLLLTMMMVESSAHFQRPLDTRARDSSLTPPLLILWNTSGNEHQCTPRLHKLHKHHNHHLPLPYQRYVVGLIPATTTAAGPRAASNQSRGVLYQRMRAPSTTAPLLATSGHHNHYRPHDYPLACMPASALPTLQRSLAWAI